MNKSKPSKKNIHSSFRLVLEYDGSRYHGWQRQGEAQRVAGVKTISDTINRQLHRVGIKVLHLAGSGRTDAGVHALGQVACLQLANPITASELHSILEQHLPFDIAVPSLAPCPSDFDPRRDAISRSYLYQIALRKCAFAKNYTWWPKRTINLKLIESAWRSFEGNHTFAAFADIETNENPNCQIYSCLSEVCEKILLLRITAKYFLRRQVRRMVGATIHCALGNADIDQISKDLQNPSNSSNLFWAERAAPASGLFLESVHYPGDSSNRAMLPVVRIRSGN
ncbi:MAG: hypothetical protein FWG02_08975 [Holophagaceae bacterium]|nr:hypothetical protein [Holophagaceae bacterium]